jgi:hypothetical protein
MRSVELFEARDAAGRHSLPELVCSEQPSPVLAVDEIPSVGGQTLIARCPYRRSEFRNPRWSFLAQFAKLVETALDVAEARAFGPGPLCH